MISKRETLNEKTSTGLLKVSKEEVYLFIIQNAQLKRKCIYKNISKGSSLDNSC